MGSHTWPLQLNNVFRATVFLLMATPMSFCHADCQPPTSCEPPREKPGVSTEQWIRRKIAAGEIADLDCYSSNPADHIISSLFLESLLTDADKNFRPQRHGAYIQHAVIQGEFELRNAEVPYDVALLDCQFRSAVDLYQSKFKKSLSFARSEFKDSVKLLYCDVSLGLKFECARFTNPDAEVFFAGMKVGDDASFARAVFTGRANFDAARVGGDLILDSATFSKAVNFESVKIGRNGFIRQTQFAAQAKLTGAEFMESLEMPGARFTDSTSRPRFDDVKVGTLLLDVNSFSATPVFRGLHFNNAVLENGGKTLAGTESNESLIRVVKPGEQSADFDSTLEEYLRRLGDSERADDLFLQQKRKERETYLTGLAWAKSRFLDLLVAYGTEPWRAFVYSLVFVIMGSVIFRNKRGMELKDHDRQGQESRLIYNPLWYSLDLFAPIIDLGAASVWAPKLNRKFARNYVYLHRILGWTLVPIGLAALSGLISKP